MRHRPHTFITLALALLLAASSWVPLPGRAEAQMRCAGASPRSAPCARVTLPAAGLTETQVYVRLMSCCRPTHSECAAMRDCPMRHTASGALAPHRSPSSAPTVLSSRRCLVTVSVCAPVPTTLALRRGRWLLAVSPALAPPPAAPAARPALRAVRVASRPDTSSLSPHAAPALHGLRAPPAA